VSIVAVLTIATLRVELDACNLVNVERLDFTI